MTTVDLCTFQNRIEDLKCDFENLRTEISLPCEIQPQYSSLYETFTHTTAITYYRRSEIESKCPKILFNESYFDEDYSERKFTLLHELIHACQRSSNLSDWNFLWLNTWDYMESKKLQYEVLSDFKNADNIEYNKILIHQLFAYVFEIWDELFVKTTYPNLFEGRMNQLYDFIIQTNYLDSFDTHPKKKEWIFMHLIRSYYLKRISEKTKAYANFDLFHNSWNSKFETVVNRDEKTEWYEWLEKLTDFSKYPDPGELKQNHINFSNKFLQN